MKETAKEMIARGLEQTELGLRPNTLEYFLMNMCAFMLLHISLGGIGQDFLDAKEAAAVKKVIDVFTQKDFLHGLKLFVDMYQFLDYLLEQEVTDDDGYSWYFTPTWIIDQWNGFVKKKNETEEKEE